jgi:hypothetical protein
MNDFERKKGLSTVEKNPKQLDEVNSMIYAARTPGKFGKVFSRESGHISSAG